MGETFSPGVVAAAEAAAVALAAEGCLRPGVVIVSTAAEDLGTGVFFAELPLPVPSAFIAEARDYSGASRKMGGKNVK